MLLLPDESVFGNKRVASRRRRTIHRDDDDDARDEFFFGVNRRCGSLGNVVGGALAEAAKKASGNTPRHVVLKGSGRKANAAVDALVKEHPEITYVESYEDEKDGVVVAFADAQREETNRAFRLRFRDDENVRVRFSRG